MRFKKNCDCKNIHGPIGLVYKGGNGVGDRTPLPKSDSVVCPLCGKPWLMISESGTMNEKRNVEIREIGGQ